jgi:hypothetical protein
MCKIFNKDKIFIKFKVNPKFQNKVAYFEFLISNPKTKNKVVELEKFYNFHFEHFSF